ncbi:DUF1302 domain-containing protein [Pandoraea pulmonicola]|uniref:DUF1302 domain-containing protein n=1 Tax=Pandoraea pulmonicola TaxID=93221 RepID=UPI001F45D871|nr:DUF1302 family protein [Pandoraea pulmonicola]
MRLTILAAGAMSALSATAMEIDLGNPDVIARWDTTLKYSNAFRLSGAAPALVANPNNDDGDRNFRAGLISNRVDLFSEMDATWQRRFGVRLSGAAYYDSVYNRSNSNPGFAGGAYPNQTSVPSNQFTSTARVTQGRNVELLDAFVFGKFDLDTGDATVRAGRHALIWGESLFFGANAIAGGQMPVDAVKLASVPGTQFKEAIRPVPQLSGQMQLGPNVSVGAYYQLEWVPNRVPVAGTYFSNNDTDVGSERMLLGPGVPAAVRLGDVKPKNSGQGGVQLRFREADTDFGLYAIRFHSKTPQVVPVLGLTPGGPAPTGYRLAYQEGITALGASASHTFGDVNLAIEGSIRHNQDLASNRGVDASAISPAPATNNTDNPGYAVGNTAHINISSITSLPVTPFWREANLTAEFAWSHVMRITRNPGAADVNGTRDGFQVRFILEPTYRNVFSGVDISIPIGMSWAPSSSRPLAAGNPNAWTPAGGGDITIGINASFRDAWRFTLAYTHYYGALGSFTTAANAFSWQQTLKDRDFIAASLRYSF